MRQNFSQMHTTLICFSLIILLLTSCSSRPKVPTLEEQIQKLTTEMENGGYLPPRTLPIDNIREVWQHDNEALEIVLTTPTEPGNYPLIIYLPGLGEHANSGKLWRDTWAKAGYSVFSIQPLAIGQALKELGRDRNDQPDTDQSNADDNEKKTKNYDLDEKPSRQGRSSELRFLGHEYFALDALKNRIEQLFWAYQQLKIRVGTGGTNYAKVDLSTVILTGYDLGAQTVAAVIGENFATALPENAAFKPVAAILLSPSIDLAEGNIRNRFQKLHLPMLVITGSEDNDPYAISSASVRAAVWEFSPVGGKYLLLLTGDVHQVLAGNALGDYQKNNQQDLNEKESGGWKNNKFSEFSNQYDSSGKRHGNGNWNGLKKESGDKNADLSYKQIAAIFSTTTAFLDKVLKNDEFATYWLDDKANSWLGGAGSIKAR